MKRIFSLPIWIPFATIRSLGYGRECSQTLEMDSSKGYGLKCLLGEEMTNVGGGLHFVWHFLLQAAIALSTTDFLFSPLPIPVLSQTKSFVEIPFQRYQLALKRQLVGRSSELDSVLLTLEECARTIQLDLAIVKGPDNEKTR